MKRLLYCQSLIAIVCRSLIGDKGAQRSCQHVKQSVGGIPCQIVAHFDQQRIDAIIQNRFSHNVVFARALQESNIGLLFVEQSDGALRVWKRQQAKQHHHAPVFVHARYEQSSVAFGQEMLHCAPDKLRQPRRIVTRTVIGVLQKH